jgi:hypothetical protein
MDYGSELRCLASESPGRAEKASDNAGQTVESKRGNCCGGTHDPAAFIDCEDACFITVERDSGGHSTVRQQRGHQLCGYLATAQRLCHRNEMHTYAR